MEIHNVRARFDKETSHRARAMRLGGAGHNLPKRSAIRRVAPGPDRPPGSIRSRIWYRGCYLGEYDAFPLFLFLLPLRLKVGPHATVGGKCYAPNIRATFGVLSSKFSALQEPDMQISRIRLSDIWNHSCCAPTRGVCAEKPHPFDLLTESLNVGDNGRADIPLLEPGCLALQVQEPT
jgi:hypothetical protein